MTVEEVMEKAARDEELTEEEVRIYEANVKPEQHVYGKYGTLAKQYLENHNVGKYWALAGNLPKYLHGVDEQAEHMWEVMRDKLLNDPKYKHTSDFMENLRKETEIQGIIEAEILKELVYV